MSDLTVLLFGPTGSGKTPSIGEAAEWIRDSSNGAKHLRLYSTDPGGDLTIRPHTNLGLVHYIPLQSVNPWAMAWAVEGKLPGPDGKWILDEELNAKVGAYAFEGFSSLGMKFLQDLSQRTAAGESIGGQSNIRFDGNSTAAKTSGADGIKVSGNNQAHFGVVQNNLRDLAFKSFRLPGVVIWTALDTRGSDEGSMATIIGPLLVGGALTSIVPSWFNLTLRLAIVPGEGKTPAEHRMYFGQQKDATAPGALAYANLRLPRDLPEGDRPKQAYVAPASFKEVMKLREGAEKNATEALRKKLGIPVSVKK